MLPGVGNEEQGLAQVGQGAALAAAPQLSPRLPGQHVAPELLQFVTQIWAKSAVVNNLWVEMLWG